MKSFLAATLAFIIPSVGSARFIDLVNDAEVIQISNAGLGVENDNSYLGVNDLDDFYIKTSGGTGECAGKEIVFRLQNMSNSAVQTIVNAGQQRAFLLAMYALEHKSKVHVYTYLNLEGKIDCKNAVYMDLKP